MSCDGSHAPATVPVQHGLDLDLLAERRAQQFRDVGDRGVDVDIARLQRLPACEGEQMLDQLGAAFGGIVDQARDALERRAGRCRLATSVSVVPEMTVSMLLKSCATPPVSLPMASSFCDWCNCRSVSRDMVAS